jgi:hypothetical protein
MTQFTWHDGTLKNIHVNLPAGEGRESTWIVEDLEEASAWPAWSVWMILFSELSECCISLSEMRGGPKGRLKCQRYKPRAYQPFKKGSGNVNNVIDSKGNNRQSMLILTK